MVLTVQSTVRVGPKDAEMPMLGLGTWQSNPGEVAEAVVTAIEQGYRHIDAAKIYQNHNEVGQGLRRAMELCNLKREDIWVTSKLWVSEAHPSNVANACRTSLQELGLTYLDQYLIHWPFVAKPSGGQVAEHMTADESTSFVEVWKEMEKLYENGLCRTIGVSNFTIKNLEDLLSSCKIKPMVNQVECHPAFPQTALKEFQKKHNIQLVAYSPLGMNTASSRGVELLIHNNTVKQIADSVGKSPAQVLLRWGIQKGHVVIPKSASADRIKENKDIYNFELTDTQMQQLEGIPNKRQLNPEFFTGKPFFVDVAGC